MIYFLKAGPFVKIGFTESLVMRINDLQVGCPYKIELLACIEGDRRLESEIHELAIDYRVAGRKEWFHHRGDLKRWLAGKDVTMRAVYSDGNSSLRFLSDGLDEELIEWKIAEGRPFDRPVRHPGIVIRRRESVPAVNRKGRANG